MDLVVSDFGEKIMLEVEYLKTKKGKTKAVVIPIKLWKYILPQDDASIEELSEGMEDYCINKAINEAQKSPLLDRQAALNCLEE